MNRRTQLDNFVLLARAQRSETLQHGFEELAYARWYLTGGYRRRVSLGDGPPHGDVLHYVLRGALRERMRDRTTDAALWQSAPGFFTFDLGPPLPDDHMRVYIRMGSTRALTFLKDVVQLIPVDSALAGKVRSDSLFSTAADAVVLYVSADGLDTLLRILYLHRTWLYGPPPALTHSFHIGLGLAPGCGSDSWGRLLCETVVHGWRSGLTSAKELAQVVDAGVPMLSAADRHAVEASWRRPLNSPRRQRRTSKSRTDLALQVFNDLVDTALWTNNASCTWLTPRPGEPRHFAPCGADVYSGTAGIALALSRGANYFDNAQMRRTAEGAARWAVANLDSLPKRWRLGLFSGAAGVRAAVAESIPGVGAAHKRTGPDFNEIDVDAHSLRQGHWDLISGVAGFVFTLRVDSEIRPIGPESMGGEAVERLRRVASRQLGLAHGRLGVLVALARLGDRVGLERALEELGLLDPERAMDFEGRLWRAGGPTWCRGSGGLIVANDLVFHASGIRVIDRAIAAANRRLARRIELCWIGAVSPGTLCHGPLGDIAVQWFHGISGDAASVLRKVGSEWYEHHYRFGPPGLMTGKAGLAHLLVHILRAEESRRQTAKSPFALLG